MSAERIKPLYIRYYEIINPYDFDNFFKYRLAILVFYFSSTLLLGMFISSMGEFIFDHTVGAGLAKAFNLVQAALLLVFSYMLYKEVILRKEFVTFFDNINWQVGTFFLGKKLIGNAKEVHFVVREKNPPVVKFERGLYSVHLWHKKPGQFVTNDGFVCYCDKMFLEVLEERFPGRIIHLK